MFKKRELIVFSRDRLAMSLLVAFLLGTLALIFLSLLNTHPSDVQVPIRYSSYGFANLYRDRWFALWSFGLFAIITFVAEGFLAFKLHSRQRGIALAILCIGIFITLLSLVVASAVFRLAAFSA
jgi:hypothetical protein